MSFDFRWVHTYYWTADWKVRPIAASPVCPTRPLSKLIDILETFLLNVESYVKDNLDLLSKYLKQNCEHISLVTFDLMNLCINIRHTLGMETLHYWLENHLENLHARFNNELVLGCAKLILENNNMKFNNGFYNKIKGTATGTIVTPTCATLSMGYFEAKLYSFCTFKYGELLAEYI